MSVTKAVEQRFERSEKAMSKRERETNIKRTALMVLGMHRSGTSALSGVLAKLGAEIPRTLMPPTADNPKGYWESSAIMEFNNAVLASAGSRWDEWETFNKGWRGTASGKAMMSKLPALLEQEFGAAPLVLIKDPRVCRMLPVWLQALTQAEFAVKIVIPVRNPLEVAESLETRNKLTRLQALLIWLRHVLDAEHDSRGQERVFTRFTDLLSDWRSETVRIAKALDMRWPRMSGRTEAEIDAYLDRALKHHTSEQKLPTGNAILGWVADAHAALCDLVEGRDAVAAEVRLDVVRQAFDAASCAFAPLFHEVRGELGGRLEERSADVGRVSGEAKELRAEITGLKQQRTADDDLIARQKAELEGLRKELDSWAAAMRDIETKHSSDRDEFAAARAAAGDELAAASNEITAVRAELAAADARARDAIAAKAGLEETHKGEIEALRKDLDSWVAAMRDLEARHSSDRDEFAAARAAAGDELAAASNEITAVRAELAAADARARDAIAAKAGLEEAHKAQLAALNERLGEKIKDVDERKAKAEALASERLSEIVALSRRMIGLEDAASAAQSGLRDTEAELEKARAAQKAQAAGLEAGRRKIEEHEGSICGLAAELSAQASVISEYRRTLDGIRSSGRWTLPGELRQLAQGAVGVGDAERPANEIEAMVRKSKLFDTSWYLAKYQDVRNRKADPVRHYLRYGAKEGRDPGPAFSSKGYIARNPDVQAASLNPLVHYLVYGRKEGRSIATGDSKPGGKV